jgi:hypothetical protein
MGVLRNSQNTVEAIYWGGVAQAGSFLFLYPLRDA